MATQFAVDRRNANGGIGEQYPFGLRALQLPDTQTDSYFLRTFGRPDREKTCECERTLEPTVTQVLQIANGDIINKKVESKSSQVAKVLAEKTPDDKIVENLYLSALSRYPQEAEKAKLLKVIAATPEPERRQAIEDLYWAVLSSKEFLFNH